MTVLPWPGETACKAPSPAATSNDRRMTGGVRSGAWKSDVTSLPSSVTLAGTAAVASVEVATGAFATTDDSTGVASATAKAGSCGPPGLALNVADATPSGTEIRLAGYEVRRSEAEAASRSVPETVVLSPASVISRQPWRSTYEL